MFCPMMFCNYPLLPLEACPCQEKDCAWWNQRFGMCAMAVVADLKGQEDRCEEKRSVADLDGEDWSFRVEREIRHG